MSEGMGLMLDPRFRFLENAHQAGVGTAPLRTVLTRAGQAAVAFELGTQLAARRPLRRAERDIDFNVRHEDSIHGARVQDDERPLAVICGLASWRSRLRDAHGR